MPAKDTGNIFGYVKTQISGYKIPVPVNDIWQWSMQTHILTTVLYKNSQLLSGNKEFKPVKNITRPILNLEYRAEGFEVKDITVYVDDSEQYYKSMLVRKFHQRWALQNKIDEVIDKMVETYVDFGGVLLKNINDVKPEVVPWESIAFCDQTDIMSGPLGIRHWFSPDQLLKMKSSGWGNPKNGATVSLQDLIVLGRNEKSVQSNENLAKTPGKYLEIIEVHGNLPKRYLDSNDTSGEYTNQIQIIGFYIPRDSDEKSGVVLYAKEEPVSPFKFLARDEIYGRALGLGGAEELFEAQVWTNYDMIRIQDLKDAAAKTLLKSTDPAVANRNKIKDMENLEIIQLQPGTDISQVDTFPKNMALFINDAVNWDTHAKEMGGATDALLGKQPTSGTPFALHQLLTQQGQSLHDYRRGKLAVFWDEVERDWIIPYLKREITKGGKFLAELDLDELQEVSTAMVNYETNKMVKDVVLSGKLSNGQAIDPKLVEGYKQIVAEEFKKKGKKHFIEILKGEFSDTPLDVRTNVAGKQKDLAGKVDKLVNLFRTILANPYILQAPPIANLFNQIVEASGLEQIDLSSLHIPRVPAMRMTQQMQFKDLPPQAQQEFLDMAGYGQQAQPSEADSTNVKFDSGAAVPPASFQGTFPA